MLESRNVYWINVIYHSKELTLVALFQVSSCSVERGFHVWFLLEKYMVKIYWNISLNCVSCCNVMEIWWNYFWVLKEKLNIFNFCLVIYHIKINTSLITLIDIIVFLTVFFDVLVVSHNSITTSWIHYNYFLLLELIMWV